MSAITELNTETVKQILANAESRCLLVKGYLKKNIETKDECLKIMHEAMGDEFFLADLEEIAEDFRQADFE